MSAATSEQETAPSSNSASCCGRRASWAGPSNIRHALRSLPERLPGAGSPDQGRAGATIRWPLPGHARIERQQRRGALRIPFAPRQRSGTDHRLLRHPGRVASRRALFTNTMPTNAYRSSGRPEVTFALERLIDIAAADLGFDRIKLRRINLIRPVAMPYTNAVGMTYDSGEYEANMDLAMRIADWDGFEARRRNAAGRGRLLGRGLANYVESSIGAPKSAPISPLRPISSQSSSALSRVARGTKPASRKLSPICSAWRWRTSTSSPAIPTSSVLAAVPIPEGRFATPPRSCRRLPRS